MNFKTTVALLVLLAGGVAAIWMFAPPNKPVDTDSGDDKNKAPAVETTKSLFDPQPDAGKIVRVQVERAGKPRLVFERKPKAENPQQMDEWRMIEPATGQADDGGVNTLVSFFTRIKTRSQFEPGTNNAPGAAAVGLEPPVATVTLAAQDGKEYKIEVGNQAAMSNDTYVRIAGQKTVHAADSNMLETQVRKDAKEYRAKNLLKFNPADVRSVKVEAEGKTYELKYDEAKGEWTLDEPVKAFGDKEKIRLWLAKFAALNILDFVADAPDSLASYGLEHPFLKITLNTETKRLPPPDPAATQPAEPKFEKVANSYTLDIGDFADMKSEKRYVKLGDQKWVANIAKTAVDGLTPKLTELRDTRITRMRGADATQLELTSGGESAVLKKVDSRWRGEGDLAELELPAIADLVSAFEDLRAIDFIDQPEDPAKYGLDQPRAILRVTGSGPVPPVTLKIGKDTASGHHTYVQLEGQATVFVTPKADRLVVTPLSLRNKAIFQLAADQQIHWIDLTRGLTRYALLKENNQWKLLEPPGAPVDANGVGDLTRQLGNLYAKRVVAKQTEDAAYGLDQPIVTIHFVAEKSAKPATSQPASAPAASQPNGGTETAQAGETSPATPPADSQEIKHQLLISRKGDATYCRKDEDPYIFELDDSVYQVFVGELIKRDLFDFKADDVVNVVVQAPNNASLALRKQDKEWKYEADPFIKLSQKKINDWLADLAKLRVDSYLAYQNADLAELGLAEAPVMVVLTLKDNRQVTLHIGQEAPGALPRKAAWVEAKRAFLLRRADVDKFLHAVDYFIQDDKKPAQPAGIPGQPPFPGQPEEEPEPGFDTPPGGGP